MSYLRYFFVLIASAVLIVTLVQFFSVPRGNTEPLTNHSRQNEVPEKKSESTTYGGSTPHAGVFSLDHVRINDVNSTVGRIAIAIGELQECDKAGCISEEPGDSAGDKVDMKKGIEKQSKIKGEKGEKKVPINYPVHSPSWSWLVIHSVLEFAGGYLLIMLCIRRLCRTWLKYWWVVACLLAFIFILYLLFEINNFHDQGWKIAAKDQLVATLLAEIELCNMSLHNEIQTNALQRKYAMELYKNHTKVLEYSIQRINEELDEVKNQTRAMTDEKEKCVKNCDQKLIEMKEKISEKDKIISQKDQTIDTLTNQRTTETNKQRMEVQSLQSENERKLNEIDKQVQSLRSENERKQNEIDKLQRKVQPHVVVSTTLGEHACAGNVLLLVSCLFWSLS